MPKLYVANATTKDHDLIYRVPEESQPRHQKIRAGTQVVVYRPDATDFVVRSIIDQHVSYGLIDAARIDQTRAFIGMCYSIDKPVPLDRIKVAFEQNAVQADANSLEQRKLTAAALHTAMNKSLGGAAIVEEVELTLLEQNKRDEPGINEAVVAATIPREARRQRSRRAAGG